MALVQARALVHVEPSHARHASDLGVRRGEADARGEERAERGLEQQHGLQVGQVDAAVREQHVTQREVGGAALEKHLGEVGPVETRAVTVGLWRLGQIEQREFAARTHQDVALARIGRGPRAEVVDAECKGRRHRSGRSLPLATLGEQPHRVTRRTEPLNHGQGSLRE